jgi:hypothetical protein
MVRLMDAPAMMPIPNQMIMRIIGLGKKQQHHLR